MIEVNGNDVSMVRGDTETLTVTPLNADGTEYQLSEGEYVEIVLKEKESQASPVVLRKTAIEGVVSFNRSDTWNLKEKSYFYNARIEDGNGKHITFIIGKFTIKPVVDDEVDDG